ncbi:MAG: NADP-dependent isocitrate dehydrogenase [Gammaproteobacteria bacterium]|nr:NADP-dependent isocitrate dehydrogenase [Gammaproteobacteria bacterium]
MENNRVGTDNMAEKISVNDGILNVPDDAIIPFIEGDGIGADITPPSLKVLDAALAKAYNGAKKITWLEVPAGEKAERETGEFLPDSTLEAFRDYVVGIKGPLMTPVGKGMRSLNVQLRQKLDLFTCLRPVRWFEGVPSPVKHPEKVNMHIFRENTEDIYAGIEFMSGTPEADKIKKFLMDEMGVTQIRFPESSSIGIKPVSEEGSKRLIRAAIRHAIKHQLPSVTLVHKGNIMKFTEGAFMRWGYEVALEDEFAGQTFSWMQYQDIAAEQGKDAANSAMASAKAAGKVIVKDVIADAFLQETLLHPEEYSVIATLNLNGDYVSDQLAATVGGIGISPGANINYNSGYAIFEATHGTAPAIIGTGKANPTSLILSGAMLLEYLDYTEAANLIYAAIEKAVSKGYVTADLHSQMEGATLRSTEQFAQDLIDNL